MYTNKIYLVLFFCMVMNIAPSSSKPVPSSKAKSVPGIDVGIDVDRILSYVDGSFKDKYNDTLDGYDSQQKYDCQNIGSKGGCNYERNSSIGSDALGYKSDTNAVAGAGYEFENQIVYGSGATHNGDISLGEGNIKYGLEADLIPLSYDKTHLGGSIGAKVGASGSIGGFGVDIGAGIGVGLGADVGYNSHEKSVALIATTPVGEFGAKGGCKTKVCFIICVSVNFCWVCNSSKALYNLLCYQECVAQILYHFSIKN